MEKEYSSLTHHIVKFCHLLYQNGIHIAIANKLDVLQALSYINFAHREEFYHTLRLILAKSPQEQQVFDRFFPQYWQSRLTTNFSQPKVSSSSEKSLIPPKKMQNSWKMSPQSNSANTQSLSYSAIEVLRYRDFKLYHNEELQEIKEAIALIAQSVARDICRRYKSSHCHKKLDLRKMIRSNLLYGEMLYLKHCARRKNRLRLITICDISGSMEKYSRFILLFMHSFVKYYSKVESFVFSTSLYKISHILKQNEFLPALQKIAQIPHFSGGTKIGMCLNQFCHQYGDTLLSSRTVVIVLSDGWDTGDIGLLEKSMESIHKKSQTVIWLNPWLASAGYQPTCRGMQVALPYIDLFAPAHNLESIYQLGKKLASL